MSIPSVPILALSKAPAALWRLVVACVTYVFRLLVDDRYHLALAAAMIMIELRDVTHVIDFSTDHSSWLSLTVSLNLVFWAYWFVRSWSRLGARSQ